MPASKYEENTSNGVGQDPFFSLIFLEQAGAHAPHNGIGGCIPHSETNRPEIPLPCNAQVCLRGPCYRAHAGLGAEDEREGMCCRRECFQTAPEGIDNLVMVNLSGC